MSNMNQSGEEQVECPLCMEPLEVDDLHFYPCTCGYQICRFCWNRIREGENGLCPACRKAYPEDPADFTPLSQEQVAALKTEKRAREQQRRTKTQESRRQLSSVRVVQRNLVFVVGLPVRLADPEILKRQEYFGKYGKIHKVVINHSTAYAGSQGPSASAYVTYVSGSDALRAIQNVNNVTIDGRVLKGSLGTTKYCANFMRNQPCPKPDCMYLHEMGDPKASFTKEEMHQGLHQVYERKLHNQLLAQTASNKDVTNTGGSQGGFIPSTVVTSSSINIANSNSLGGLGVGVMLSSSSSSSSSSGSSKEAWPSLGCSPPTSHSPTLRNESTPSPQPSNDIEPLGTNNIPQSNGKTKNRNSKDKANGEKWTKSQQQQQQTNSAGTSSSKNNRQGKNKTDKHQRQHINNNNNPGSSNSSSNSNSNITENNIKLCNNGTQETNGTALENNKPEDKDVGGVGSTTTNMEYSEQTFSNGQSLRENMLDGDDRHSLLDNLLDSSDHSLLEDNDNHDLLNDDCPIVSQDNTHSLLMNRYQGMMSGLPMHTQTMQTNINNLDFGAGMSCNGEYYSRLGGGDTGELLLLQRQQQLNMQQLNRPMHQQHHIRQHGLLDGQSMGSEGSRYIGENSMDKFLIDFHKNQQLKQMLRGAPAGPGALPATANVPSLTYIESHLHKYPGLQQAGNSKPLLMNPQSQQLLQQQHQQLQQQQEQQRQHTDDDLDFDPFKETQKAFAEMDIEKEILANKSREDGTEFGRTSRPPPGFTHMNAFGIGVPRPQTNSGFPGSGSGVSDWTQMDPAIMSTSCSFPQQNNDVLLQQQDMYARFNPQLHMNGMSKVLPLMQSASQQQPPHRGGNGLILPNTSSRQPQFMPGKLIPNGWNPQGGSLILQNGQQYNNMNAPRLNGFYNSNEMNTMKYGGIPLPPGFSSSVPQVQTKNSSNATECIESK